ncbi:MAG: site-specific integrase [Burkholderiaceae bacterium]|nr:site-specific integrase [Sulfuritalea sp.]MCF8175121.1 site-specific integrase [Burkholderiaceae bacterium]
MATFRKLDSGKWQFIIRRKGHAPVFKTFSTRSDGDKWARHLEGEMDRGAFVSRTSADSTTLGELIDRYIGEVSPLKRSCKNDTQRLRYLKNHFGNLSASAIRSTHIAQWRDKRLSEGKAGSTVVKEINSLSHVLDTAIKDWGIGLPSNVAKQVRKPKQARGRDRRVAQDELIALQATRIAPIVTLAIETGMRLGELLSLEWRLIDLDARTATLPLTKNGEKRIVPLSPVALSTLAGMEHKEERLFGHWKAADSFENAWKRTLVRLRKGSTNPIFLTDLRFHDLRHEAASRLFEKGLNMMEVASVTGHKSLVMLKRYTHLRATDIASKLALAP